MILTRAGRASLLIRRHRLHLPPVALYHPNSVALQTPRLQCGRWLHSSLAVDSYYIESEKASRKQILLHSLTADPSSHNRIRDRQQAHREKKRRQEEYAAEFEEHKLENLRRIHRLSGLPQPTKATISTTAGPPRSDSVANSERPATKERRKSRGGLFFARRGHGHEGSHGSELWERAVESEEGR